MKKHFICSMIGCMVLTTFTLRAQTGKNLWVTGVFTQNSDNTCNCSNVGGLTYSFNGQQVLMLLCLDQVGTTISNGAWVTVSGVYTSGQCSSGATLFSVNKIIDTQKGLSGTFNKVNYKCPLSNEGSLTLSTGAKWDVASSKAVADGQSINVSSFAWGVKQCEGNFFQTYYIYDYSSSGAQGSSTNNAPSTSTSNTTKQTFTGYFSSKRGVMHPLSLLGYNIGEFNEMQKGGGSYVVCFDRLAGGSDLNISSNPIVIEGYFEEAKKKDADPYMQTTTDDFSQKVFYVTKWRYY